MTRKTTQASPSDRLVDLLREQGPSTSQRCTEILEITQPTFSRWVKELGRLLVSSGGRGKYTLYGLRRDVTYLDSAIPIYQIRPAGQRPSLLAHLYPVEPRGFLLELVSGEPAQYHEGIPWFVQDLMPRGYLGRQAPRLYPELSLTPDIRHWQEEDFFRYLTHAGWDLPGALIVGDSAYQQWMDGIESTIGVARKERTGVYPKLAERSREFGHPGSSAAGEQPKFLTVRQDAEGLVPVLVKFSPPVHDALSRRTAWLLRAEHECLVLLNNEGGIPAVRSELIESKGRVFLETERFDRQGIEHRRGVCSLESMDAEFIGTRQFSWSQSVEELKRLDKLAVEDLRRVRLLEYFGLLIGNSDMHFGNLSIYMDGLRPTNLAPIYDMLPMFYAPRSGELPRAEHPLPDLSPGWADVAPQAVELALRFWSRMAEVGHPDPDMRSTSRKNVERIGELERRLRLLPLR